MSAPMIRTRSELNTKNSKLEKRESFPRDWHLSGSYVPNWGHSLRPLVPSQHSIVLRGLRGWPKLVPRGMQVSQQFLFPSFFFLEFFIPSQEYISSQSRDYPHAVKVFTNFMTHAACHGPLTRVSRLLHACHGHLTRVSRPFDTRVTALWHACHGPLTRVSWPFDTHVTALWHACHGHLIQWQSCATPIWRF